jgi:hypothetical protein
LSPYRKPLFSKYGVLSWLSRQMKHLSLINSEEWFLGLRQVGKSKGNRKFYEGLNCKKERQEERKKLMKIKNNRKEKGKKDNKGKKPNSCWNLHDHMFNL